MVAALAVTSFTTCYCIRHLHKLYYALPVGGYTDQNFIKATSLGWLTKQGIDENTF